jgi:hypothetical protein
MSAAVRAFRRQQDDVAALAYDEVLRFWRTLDLTDPDGVVLALEAFLPEVIRDYGDVGAAIAADFYDDLRANEPAVRRAYRARLAGAVPIEQARASTRWAAGPLYGKGKNPVPEQALANVLAISKRLVLAPSRETIRVNAEADPEAKGWRRETSADGCRFCRFLAGRGEVYSGETARFAAHDRCGCTAVPAWGGKPASALQYVASSRNPSPRDRERLKAALDDFEAPAEA